MLLLLTTSAPTFANNVVDRAEYIRLAGEIRNLADRQAWSGVERAYQAALLTQHPLAFRDHVAGAHAAAASGDVSAVRTRLHDAHQLEEDREIIEWLWNIDTDYGKVALTADVGIELVATEMSFDPARARAVAYAAEKLAETGTYQGLLPSGAYQVGDVVFFVTPGADEARVTATDGKRRRSKRAS